MIGAATVQCGCILPDDVAAGADPVDIGIGSAGKINRNELSSGPQKTMGRVVDADISSDNVDVRRDSPCLCAGRAREIDLGESGAVSQKIRCCTQREAKREQVSPTLLSH